MNSPVTTIKERLSIEEVISSYLKLEQAGQNLKARCPFHNEKTPSFFVSPTRGSYYCFGCGASGDIFTFLEQFEGLDFKGALKLLADRAGVALEAHRGGDEDVNSSEKERLYQAMEQATQYFRDNLERSNKVVMYLKNRGLTDQSIKDFAIGFADNDWRLLYNHLKEKKFTDTEIEKAGLAKKTEKGMYDRFRGRVMFPISDSTGRVIAFSGRIFVDDGKSAKYLNSPDTPIFNKFRVLYGLDKAKESIRKNNFSILVEGQMDLVLSHQAGYRNTVATSGTALSDVLMSRENVISNLGLIRRLSPNIVLAFDGDKAGMKASERAGRIALALGMDVKVAPLPEGVDPADIISKRGVDSWKGVVRESKHIIEHLLDRVLKEAKENKGDIRTAGRMIKDLVLPYVHALESSIEQMHFIKKIADASSIKEEALQDDLKKIQEELRGEDRAYVERQERGLGRKDNIIRKLVAIVLWQSVLKDKSLEIDAITKKLEDLLSKKFEELFTEEDKNNLIFEAEVFYGAGADLKKDIEELLRNLRWECLKEELFIKMGELRVAEEKKDRDKMQTILERINEINTEVHNIKNSRLKNI